MRPNERANARIGEDNFEFDSAEKFHEDVLGRYQNMTMMANEYQRKQVLRVECGDCNTVLTDRGMSAVLLTDRAVQLFSTDLAPYSVGFIQGDYPAAACSCRVRDIGCKNCGNVIGYHVNVPCKVCLSQPNNGHYWMFRSSAVKAQVIYLHLAGIAIDVPLLWGFVRSAGDFTGMDFRSGDEEAARSSCQLSVTLSNTVDLIVHKPKLTAINPLLVNDEDIELEYAKYIR